MDLYEAIKSGKTPEQLKEHFEKELAAAEAAVKKEQSQALAAEQEKQNLKDAAAAVREALIEYLQVAKVIDYTKMEPKEMESLLNTLDTIIESTKSIVSVTTDKNLNFSKLLSSIFSF